MLFLLHCAKQAKHYEITEIQNHNYDFSPAYAIKFFKNTDEGYLPFASHYGLTADEVTEFKNNLKQ